LKTKVDYDLQIEKDKAPVLILYRYRWLVLISFFLTSAATGVMQASLSTNRAIIDNIYTDANRVLILIAKYADLPLYLPANFISTKVIETYGLRRCIVIGSLLMLTGSTVRLFALFGSFIPVFFGHILSLSGQAFLKNPVSKLATNWFGDNERGIATGIGIMAGPSGILLSSVLIMTCLNTEDKDPGN
jgi:sugar phosphate permease